MKFFIILVSCMIFDHAVAADINIHIEQGLAGSCWDIHPENNEEDAGDNDSITTIDPAITMETTNTTTNETSTPWEPTLPTVDTTSTTNNTTTTSTYSPTTDLEQTTTTMEPEERCGQIDNSAICPENYTGVGGVGCIHVADLAYIQNDAKDYCQNLKGVLVIPKKFECLRQFMRESNTYNMKSFWVAIENGKWVNGDPILEEQTARGLSNSGGMTCAYIHVAVDYLLQGYGCGYTAISPICMPLTYREIEQHGGPFVDSSGLFQ